MESNGYSMEVDGVNVDFHGILEKANISGWDFVKIEWKNKKGDAESDIFATEHGRKRLEKVGMIETTDGFCYSDEYESLLRYFKRADTFPEFMTELEELERVYPVAQTIKITNFC